MMKPCAVDADCAPGDTCAFQCWRDRCLTTPFVAHTAADLESMASGRAGVFYRCEDSCTVVLASRPSDPQFISVTVNGVSVPGGPDSWAYDPQVPAVVFPPKSPTCQHLTHLKNGERLTLEVRVLQVL